MTQTIQLLDVVAVARDIAEKNLSSGQVGSVVEVLGPDVFEVEFSDQNGKMYALAALNACDLLVLRYEPIRATG